MEILSREDRYPLQISKTMDTSQQAISKHLKTMEKEGIVVSRKCKSERGGPPTKRYMVNSEFSLRIDLGPTLFKTEVERIEDEKVEGYEDIEEELREAHDEETLKKYRTLIQEIEDEIDELEKKRKHLTKLKERALSKGYDLIHDKFQDHKKSYILYYILNSGVTDIKKIAEEFKVREDEIENIMENVKEKTDLFEKNRM